VKLALENGADLAVELGREQAVDEVLAFTRGRGGDAVLIAAATPSSAPVEMAARLARDRARVIMVGVTGANLPRPGYFAKELTFLVSRSYGPGRYDRQYEQQGRDYPIGYVRWTENRNMEGFLDLVAGGRLQPERCTSHRFSIGDAAAAFELVATGHEPYLGVVLTYQEKSGEKSAPEPTRITLADSAEKRVDSTPLEQVGVSFLGAGGFARSVHLPNLARLPGVRLRGIVDAVGMAARSAARKFHADFCASAEAEILGDPQTAAVFVTTPHSQHAATVCRVLAAGKTVFVEKPLAISLPQVGLVADALRTSGGRLMVGFNRRFAPLALELKKFLAGRGPLAMTYRCNAGPSPAEHWIADPAEGGRILGEACHFFDFFAYLTGATPLTVYAVAPAVQSLDDASASITYADGSVGHLVYTSNGPSSFSKERIEVFAGRAAGVLEDFRRLELRSESGGQKRRQWFQADKGHRAEVAAFIQAIRAGDDMPIPADSLIDTTLVSLAVLESLRRKAPVMIADLRRAFDEPAALPNPPFSGQSDASA
jgi:predicted dehydrogenase